MLSTDPEKEGEGDIARFEDVIAALEILERGFDISYVLVRTDEPSLDGQYSLFPFTYGDWPYLDVREEQRRRVLIAELVYHKRSYYLFDTERRFPSEIGRYKMLLGHSFDGKPLSATGLESILQFCADQQGRWPTTGELKGLVARQPHLHHSKNKKGDIAPSLAQRIAVYLVKNDSRAQRKNPD